MPVQVGGLSVCTNVNTPCTSVTVCIPGTTKCQTVDNILVDTGSYGLRVFSQALNSVLCQGLPVVSDDEGHTVGECAQFGSANDWGPVMNADVQLGSEPVVNTSIQVINRNFATPPGACTTSDSAPQEAFFNGILGVGLKATDCPNCATTTSSGYYYSCNGTACSAILMPLAMQVQNPVALLKVDSEGHTNNNGVVLSFPSTQDSGNASITGSLYLGIGTAANNTPSETVQVFNADAQDNIQTWITDSTSCTTSSPCASFIDSGSNAYYIPNGGLNLATCPASSVAPGFYCPTSEGNLSAENIGAQAGQSAAFTLTVANASNQVSSGNQVFDNIGAPGSSFFSNDVDLGLPFFFGKTIYVGIEGRQASFGSHPTGPYWAY
jgi:hypothetical protein